MPLISFDTPWIESSLNSNTRYSEVEDGSSKFKKCEYIIHYHYKFPFSSSEMEARANLSTFHLSFSNVHYRESYSIYLMWANIYSDKKIDY